MFATKLSKTFFPFFKITMTNTLDKEELVNIYYAMAYSHTAFNIIYWGSGCKLDKVLIMQKRVIGQILD